MIITAIETTTVHDWQPSHSMQPAEVIDAREMATWCWKAQAEASLEERELAHQAAVEAQDWYDTVYQNWMNGIEPVIASQTETIYVFAV